MLQKWLRQELVTQHLVKSSTMYIIEAVSSKSNLYTDLLLADWNVMQWLLLT